MEILKFKAMFKFKSSENMVKAGHGSKSNYNFIFFLSPELIMNNRNKV